MAPDEEDNKHRRQFQMSCEIINVNDYHLCNPDHFAHRVDCKMALVTVVNAMPMGVT